MLLEDVWSSLDDDLKRVFHSAARADERIDSPAILESLLLLPEDDDVGQILRRFNRDHDLGFCTPDELPETIQRAPEDISLSPPVREALQFFRMHKIRPVNVRDYTRRLLQIGSDRMVRQFEKQGILRDMIDQLQ